MVKLFYFSTLFTSHTTFIAYIYQFLLDQNDAVCISNGGKHGYSWALGWYSVCISAHSNQKLIQYYRVQSIWRVQIETKRGSEIENVKEKNNCSNWQKYLVFLSINWKSILIDYSHDSVRFGCTAVKSFRSVSHKLMFIDIMHVVANDLAISRRQENTINDMDMAVDMLTGCMQLCTSNCIGAMFRLFDGYCKIEIELE